MTAEEVKAKMGVVERSLTRQAKTKQRVLENQGQAGMGELGGRAGIRVAEKMSQVEMMG